MALAHADTASVAIHRENGAYASSDRLQPDAVGSDSLLDQYDDVTQSLLEDVEAIIWSMSTSDKSGQHSNLSVSLPSCFQREWH